MVTPEMVLELAEAVEYQKTRLAEQEPKAVSLFSMPKGGN